MRPQCGIMIAIQNHIRISKDGSIKHIRSYKTGCPASVGSANIRFFAPGNIDVPWICRKNSSRIQTHVEEIIEEQDEIRSGTGFLVAFE